MKKWLNLQIWLYTLAVIVIGLVALYSASYENVRVSQKIFFDQLYFSLAGVVIMYLLERFDYRRYYDIAYILYILNIILLVMVLVSGRHALGARRWIEIGGFGFQPSELTKLSLIFILGRYIARRRPKLSFSFLTNAQIFIQDAMLNPLHQLDAMKVNHGGIDARIHYPKGIRGCHKTVVRGQVFKTAFDDRHAGEFFKTRSKRITHF